MLSINVNTSSTTSSTSSIGILSFVVDVANNAVNRCCLKTVFIMLSMLSINVDTSSIVEMLLLIKHPCW